VQDALICYPTFLDRHPNLKTLVSWIGIKVYFHIDTIGKLIAAGGKPVGDDASLHLLNGCGMGPRPGKIAHRAASTTWLSRPSGVPSSMAIPMVYDPVILLIAVGTQSEKSLTGFI
jgi:hypothetical protein